ncbi:MAG: globin domain-containing protein [Cyanobacteria bacterium P01_A01_bin.40]
MPEHYPLVGNALLETFEQYLGEKWTPSVKQSWVEAYNAITELMLDGANHDEEKLQL